jgi:hypothetical protein
MKTSFKIIYWSPRILGILAILFLSLFALDAFESSLTIWQQLGAFLIHLIPSFILTALLIVAWNYELIGGSIFVLIGIVLTPLIFNGNYAMNQSVPISLAIISSITLPFIIAGMLFITNHFLKKKQQTQP